MKKRMFFSGAILSLVFAGLGIWALDSSSALSTDDQDSAYANVQVFTRVLQLIRQDYVDDKKVGYRDLTYAAMRGMLDSLDPHSQFMPPEDFKDMQDDTNSEFGGLGMNVTLKDGYLTIISPVEGTPAHKAGLMPNDQILKINGTSTEHMDLSDSLRLLHGEAGEKITLTIYRPATKELKDYTLTREIIKIESVKDAKILDPALTGDFKIGYLRITQFNKPTADELVKKLDELEGKGMQALVIDLRYNPGGLLNSAVDVCAQFLPAHTLVVSTEGRAESQKHSYFTEDGSDPSRKAKQRKYPLAILINGSSASGAEIVAGALKDLNRAVLVGETSFGKGSVQSVIQLPDGSALRLTTARYYTPSHYVIHEHGVTPNIRATFTPEQERQLLLQRREEQTGETEKLDPNFHDTQLERAADALKGVMIYAEKAASQPEPGTD
ncbi:MAG TPA: S41 family peptidase, partial [Chthoniobacteraceae bacterium]|nr:S41 family peptidase [Chthoniobacteraceae bacterium]